EHFSGSNAEYAPTEWGPVRGQRAGLVIPGANRRKRRMRSDRGQRPVTAQAAPTPSLAFGIETTGVRLTGRERCQGTLPPDANRRSTTRTPSLGRVSAYRRDRIAAELATVV